MDKGDDAVLSRIALTFLFLTNTLIAQTPSSPTAPPPNLAPLFAHIWRITSATPYPNSGSIYIFQPSGTLLETSCVETYRIATWKTDPKQPGTLEVTEDGRVAFTAAIASLTDRDLRLHQVLLLGGKRESREVTLAAVDKEFVCPDLPK
jgi:hypothetical protein